MSSLSILENLDTNFSGSGYNTGMGRSRMAQSMTPSIPLDEYGSAQRSMPRSMYGPRQDTQDHMDYDLMKREQKRALSAMADRASRHDQPYKAMHRGP